MADDASIQDQTDHLAAPGDTAPGESGADLPDRLRVHSLARVLGTTSRKVLDALSQLDGRTRSAHSSVERTDAVRVRDVLAQAQPEDTVDDTPAAEVAVEVAVEVADVEPESRLLLETPDSAERDSSQDPSQSSEQSAAYLPLFVAPSPVAALPPAVVTVDASDDDDDDDDDESDEDREDGDSDDADDDQSDRPANRRRRRGRRGRGRGRGSDGEGDAEGDDAAGVSDEDGPSEETGGSDDDGGDDDAAGADGASKRRRRRRRRKTGSGDGAESGSPDDPPNTVVHERAPRERQAKSGKGDPDEIQGISGSTRLEAKRQRRRDGRDAGRRRPPILSEAEFLARREAVERVMVVRDKVRSEPPHEGALYTQIAVLEDGVVVEHFVTSAASASLVGNIYLGIVQNVLPSMEAAFIDIGRGRNGVLYAGEVNWEAAGLGGAQRKIEQALRPGDYVVVQVSKDPIGHKGARLTTQVSLAGRYLVYVPGASSTGISRKLPDTERQRLKEILREVVPADAGVIIRTASEGVKEEDIRTDVARLQERWIEVDAKAAEVTGKKAGAAIALYEEPDVLVKVIRDLFNEDFSSLTVSGDNAWETINEYVNSVAPELVSKLVKYEPAVSSGGVAAPDVFAVHRIDEQLAKAMDRKVWLPSGGTLVIDRTEAMTVVDVNTGKFTGAGGNLEQTVTKNNLEAAEETVRQLRLRDIGGIVVIDFIDMVLESNRDLVLRRLTEALARDRTRHQISEVTSLGLVQLTRKRLGTGLVEAFSTTCSHCAGRGIVLHSDPVDNAQSTPRKSDNGGGTAVSGGSRRGKRGGKKGRVEEVVAESVVAKVPPHTVGDHPMFKAMAAASDKDEDDDEIVEDVTAIVEDVNDERDAPELDLDEDDSEEDDDIDDIDLDDDDESDDDDPDEDDPDEDDDPEDSDDEDDDDDGSDEDDDVAQVTSTSAGRPRRRRAAARPAGPPR